MAQAYWSGFSDVESGITTYKVAVGIGRFDVTTGQTIVYPEFYFPFTDVGIVASFSKSIFSFSDGDNIFLSVQAINQAGLGTIATSDGYIIDL